MVLRLMMDLVPMEGEFHLTFPIVIKQSEIDNNKPSSIYDLHIQHEQQQQQQQQQPRVHAHSSQMNISNADTMSCFIANAEDTMCISCHGEISSCRRQIVKVYTDTSSYSGEICTKTGKRWNKGVFINRHGDTFDGNWHDDKRNGYGMYEWKTGDKYDGEWKRGAMDGQGAFKWSTGDSFVGHWKRGKMDGFGTKIMANGDAYTGMWKNDKANGKGCKHFSCGDRHEGEYKDDKRHGHGVYYWASGDRYEGLWECGEMHGHGTKIMANGDAYHGTWVADKAHGWGRKLFSGGDSHEGEYRNDARHGYGTYSWANNDKFEGEWVDGEQTGKGTYQYRNGDAFKGTWKNGKKHGRGIFSSKQSQSSVIERWENGCRFERFITRYYPVRLLRTTRSDCDVKKEKLRLLCEIDRLRNRLEVIESAERSETETEQQTQLTNLISDISSIKPTLIESNSTVKERSLVLAEPLCNRADEEERRRIELLLDNSISLETAMTIIESAALSSSGCILSPSSSTTPVLPDDATCKICMNAIIDTVLMRCGHMAICLNCSKRIDKCPVCRSMIDEVIVVYRP